MRVLLQCSGILLQLPLWHWAQYSSDEYFVLHPLSHRLFFDSQWQSSHNPAFGDNGCDHFDCVSSRSGSRIFFCFCAAADLRTLEFVFFSPFRSFLKHFLWFPILKNLADWGLQRAGSLCFISGQRKDSRSAFPADGLLLHIMLSISAWSLHTWTHSELLFADFVGCCLAETIHWEECLEDTTWRHYTQLVGKSKSMSLKSWKVQVARIAARNVNGMWVARGLGNLRIF